MRIVRLHVSLLIPNFPVGNDDIHEVSTCTEAEASEVSSFPSRSLGRRMNHEFKYLEFL